jgi:uncharacterized membrane protein YfcA
MTVLDPVSIVVIGFISQFINGSLGMGFGATSSSVFIALGLAVPAVISASVHIGKVFAGMVSGASHHHFGNVDRELTVRLTMTGVVGGVVGAYFLSHLESDLVVPIIAVILLVMGLRIFLRFYIQKKRPHPGPPWGYFPHRLLLPLGFFGGLVDAFGGAGWGPICMASLAGRTKKEIRVLVGSVSMAEFFVSVAIVTTFIICLGPGGFLLWITVPLIIGGMMAAPIAAYAVTRITPTRLGMAVGGFLVVINTFTLARYPPTVAGIISIPPVAIILMIITAVVLIIWIKRYRQLEARKERRATRRKIVRSLKDRKGKSI